MTALDLRARSAAGAIHSSVGGFVPTVSVHQLHRRRMWNRIGSFAMAAAVVAVLIGLATMVQVVLPDRPVAVPNPSISVTTPETPVTPTDPVTPDREALPPIVGDDESTDIDVPTSVPPTTVPPDVDPPVVPPPTTTTTTTTTHPPDREPPDTEPPDTEPPFIEITSPKDGAVFHESRVRFEGETEPGARVFAGRYEADVDRSGHWSIVLVLSEGANGARFRATDAAGNTAEARIVVYYEPEQPPKDDPPDDRPDVRFTAHATYGSCELDPPFDVYYGTAQPGSKITISSEFGGGTARVNAKGRWELKVFFPEAPYGETFVVRIQDEFDHVRRFEFVSYAG